MTPNNYVTLQNVKDYWPNNEVSKTNVYDTSITTLCTNMSRMFDTLTWRRPGDFAVTVPDTRYFDGIPFTASDYLTQLQIGELAAVPTTIISDGYTLLSTDYWAWPYNSLVEFRPFTHLILQPDGALKVWTPKVHGISVTGLFGYSQTVPPDIFEGLLLYVSRMVRKLQQNYMDVGTLLDSGQIMLGAKTDNDLQELILHYRKSRLGYSVGSFN